jgi:hypothetical protein
MKLKLIFLPWHHVDPIQGKPYEAISFPPLGIAMLTAFLRKHGIKVEQDDLDVKVVRYNEKFLDSEKAIKTHLFADETRVNKILKGHEEMLEIEGEKILKLTDCKGFDVIGFSLQSSDTPSVAGIAATLGKLIKEKYGSTVIMGGGIEKTAQYKLLGSKFIDCMIESSNVTPQGEVNLLKFCEMYESGVNIIKIPGVVYMRDGKLTTVGKPTKVKRCFFTLPDFDGLPLNLHEDQISSQINDELYSSKILILPYLFIYGCPNSCIYCTYSKSPLMGTKDPEKVAEDLEFLSKKYHTRYFFFLNTEINVTKQYANAVAEELIKHDLDILWSDCATFKNMDIKLLRKLKEAGAARLVWGLESVSPDVLNYVRKDINIPQAQKYLRKSFELNIWNHLELICGFPYEKETDVDITISFLKRNREYIHEIVLNKFFIDGLLEQHPERYGIRLREFKKIYRTWTTKLFDEINGLRWEEKMKQTQKSYHKLRKAFARFGISGEKPINRIFHVINLQRNLGIKFSKEEALTYVERARVSHLSFL